MVQITFMFTCKRRHCRLSIWLGLGLGLGANNVHVHWHRHCALIMNDVKKNALK